MPPAWLALLAPLPDDVVVERRPVASPQLVAAGKAEAIAGWDSLTVNLSDSASGLRHVMITLDERGTVISGGDGVLRHRAEQRGSEVWNIYDHQNIGGRFDADGAFHGTCWQTHNEHRGDDDVPASSSSTPSAPTAEEIDKLRALVKWMLQRAPERRT